MSVVKVISSDSKDKTGQKIQKNKSLQKALRKNLLRRKKITETPKNAQISDT